MCETLCASRCGGKKWRKNNRNSFICVVENFAVERDASRANEPPIFILFRRPNKFNIIQAVQWAPAVSSRFICIFKQINVSSSSVCPCTRSNGCWYVISFRKFRILLSVASWLLYLNTFYSYRPFYHCATQFTRLRRPNRPQIFIAPNSNW